MRDSLRDSRFRPICGTLRRMAENGCPWCGCELTFRAVDGTPICSGCNHVRRRAPLPADPDGEAEAMRKVHGGGPKVER